MRPFVVFVLSVVLAASSAGLAQDNVMRAPKSATPILNRFVTIDALDFKAIVPTPPAAGSIAAQAELETLLQVQSWRTPDQVAWAKLVAADDVFNHAAIIGEWFNAERLPLTAALFKQIGDDMRAMDALAKKPFARPRPSAVEPRLRPCVNVPSSSSYPSGSALQALVWAEILAEAMPSKRTELIARAHRAAWGRVIGGVHYPSDLVTGRMLAEVYLTECRKSRAFQQAFAACRQELAAASGAR
jgi:acid phosphatase (class A)